MPYDNKMNPRHEAKEHRPIPEILHDIDCVILWHKCFNDKAMKMCQAAGYNGFKRMHRYNTRCFLNWHMKLENEAYDKFRFTMDTHIDDFNIMWGSLVDHLKNWDAKLDQDIDELAMLNNEYRMCAGEGNCIVEKALHKMVKNHEKTGRWYKRFEETKSAHDQHELDDAIHARYKKKEEKYS